VEDEFVMQFKIERVPESGLWRASLADDQTEWGFGDLPHDAVIEYCTLFMPDSEQLD